MFRLSISELKKQFKRMGIKADIIEIKAARLTIESEDKLYVMESPQTVLLVKLPGGISMLQAIGGVEEKEREETETSIEVNEEDVELVAQQAGVSREEARRALIEAKGDIAEAILLLEERKNRSL
ncbi:MAG: nascent polypeptide-associated complex protein [Pyrodictiaceae archaeon]